jgi:hypothetical protein
MTAAMPDGRNNKILLPENELKFLRGKRFY